MSTTVAWNVHRNDLDDWCPWSNPNLTAQAFAAASLLINDDDDERCPAGCQSSHFVYAGHKGE